MMPPWRSARVTTPIGIDIQSRTAGLRRARSNRRAFGQPHQFRRAAADVEQDRALARRIDQRRTAGCRKPGLGLPIHHLQVDSDLIAHDVDEFGAVRRQPARLGGDQPGACHVAASHLAPADPQRVDRPADGLVAEPARRADPLAEPDDAGKRIHDAKTVAASDARPAAGNCWCQGPAQHRLDPTRLPVRRIVVARIAMGRPPDPPSPRGRRIRSAAEAGCPDLVVHVEPFPTPKLDGLNGAAVIVQSCSNVAAGHRTCNRSQRAPHGHNLGARL